MTVLSTIDLKILLQFVCIDHTNIHLFCQNENNPFSPYMSTITVYRDRPSCAGASFVALAQNKDSVSWVQKVEA